MSYHTIIEELRLISTYLFKIISWLVRFLVIFILDSNQQSITLLQSFLSELDYQVKVFRYPDPLLAAYRKERPGMVFVRVGSSEINGLKVTRQVRAIDNQAKVVFLSKYKDYVNFVWEVGAIDFLLEPFGQERFIEVLARAG